MRSPRKPRRLPGAVTAAALAASVLVACGADGERPSIVVTTNILGDVVTRLVGDAADVQVLMRPDADPHSFGISAREAGDMQQADLIVANGLGLEEGLGSNLDNAREEGVEVLEVGDLVDPLPYVVGDDEGDADPHFWTDPGRMIDAVGVIESRLSGTVGTVGTVGTAAAAYRDELVELDRLVEDSLGSVPRDRRTLVTNHHVFGYLADRFGYEVVGTVIPGGSTLAAPSAGDLRDLSRTITVNDVPAIFADSSQPTRLAEVLADEADLDVEVVALFTESLTGLDGDAATYVEMQRTNAERIADALN